VVQPSWNDLKKDHKIPGPFLQVDMFKADKKPPYKEIEAFCEEAKAIIQNLKRSKTEI
jgi:hypothetical protein